MIVGVVSLTGAMIIYRKASYDKIQIFGLILFVCAFILDFTATLYRDISTEDNIIL
jgi:hypothetical protein